MKSILLDTNMLIYREGEKILNENVQFLLRLIMDSEDYKIYVHPLSLKEIEGHKIEHERNIILSKLKAYPMIQNPPTCSPDFLKACGETHSLNDDIDNCLLFALMRNCVDYFITNDKGILKKSFKLKLNERVLSIDQAIQLLCNSDKTMNIESPVFVSDEYLYNLDINDEFFDSLKEDYKGFELWFAKKAKEHIKAYVTFLDEQSRKLGSFLLLKVEDELEQYPSFQRPFSPGKRVKVSTLKVLDNGKSIGETYIKFMIEFAIKNDINEIYVTIFKKQNQLVSLLQEYDFKLYSLKETTKANGDKEDELVLLKNLDINYTAYPIINIKDQKLFVIPIQHEFHEMLFPETNNQFQFSINYLAGSASYSNAIKKVYISKSRITKIEVGDILVFYSSQIKKELSCIGVVDEIFRAQEIKSFQEFEKIVQRRTVFHSNYLRETYNHNDLIILFKHYINLQNHIPLKMAIDEGILNGAPQTIQSMDIEKFKKLVKLSNSMKQIKFNL